MGFNENNSGKCQTGRKKVKKKCVTNSMLEGFLAASSVVS
jgi:hypothetical protein